MKRYLVAPLLALSLLLTGCFTSMGALHGITKKDTNAGAVVGYAFLGALADTAAFFALVAALAFKGNDREDRFDRQLPMPSAPTLSPLEIPR